MVKDFTKGREWRQILSFTLPMLAGNVFMQLYQFVDMAIVGRYIGKEAMAAVGASTPVIFMTIALVMGMGIGASIVISQYFGAKIYSKVQVTIDTLMVFLLVAGVAVTLFGIFFAPQILRLTQLPPELMPMAEEFLQIYFLGMVMSFGYNAVASVLRGVGDSVTPLWFLIFSTLLNVVLDLLFIPVLGWGVGGAAWATVISQAVAFVSVVWYVNRTSLILKFNVINPKFDKAIFRDCLRMGLPSGLQQTFVAVGMLALMGIVNTFGTDVIAAYSAVNRVDAFVAMPVMSFAAALTTFVGQNAGAGKYIRINRGLKSTLIISTSFCMVLNAIMILFGRPILSIFTTDPVVLDIGYQYLWVINSSYVLFNVMFVTNGMLRGAGATIFPMVMTLMSLWICRIPAAMLLSKHFGPMGIWWAIPIAWAIGMLGSAGYYFSGKWKTKSIMARRRMAAAQEVVAE